MQIFYLYINDLFLFARLMKKLDKAFIFVFKSKDWEI